MKIKLLVLKTPNIKKLADFFSLLGMTFDYHKHTNSPYHYSTTINDTVLEIYPLAKDQTESDPNLRLGFEIDNFDETISNLKEVKTTFFLEPTQTDFGFMAIIADSDGRKIELYRKN